MKFSTTLLVSIFILATASLTFSSCNKDDDQPAPPEPRTQEYQLTAYGSLDIKGNAVFKEILNTNSVKVTIHLEGEDMGPTSSLPVKIRKGTSIEDGDVLYKLGNYDGSTSKMVEKIKLSFDDLLTSNISLGVYNPNNGSLVSQAEIGANATFKSFSMVNPNTDKKNGQFRVYKREEGSYVVVKLDQDKIMSECQGNNHPITVFDADNLADANFNLDSVAHSDGISATALPNFSYKDVKTYQGTIKIYCSKTQEKTVISVGKFKE